MCFVAMLNLINSTADYACRYELAVESDRVAFLDDGNEALYEDKANARSERGKR